MGGRRHGTGSLVIPAVAMAGVTAGASSFVYYVGEGFAYLSLAFGLLFFVFAVRYYIATVTVLVAPSDDASSDKNGKNGNGQDSRPPMVSVHVALYNEERVVDRLLTACSNLDYPNYEVVVVDDSNDGTVGVLKEWLLRQLQLDKPRIKIIHRDNRQGFKGGALNEALRNTSPRAEYVVVFDADFIPQPDTLRKFVAYFDRHGPNGNGNGNGNGRYANGKLAAVQGYQWHTLNRSENWLTRGVSCEFSGNYMVDRTFQEVTGSMKMVAGSVYAIRADILRRYGWSESITEDWEMTLRLYREGYKVLYTPLIQSPAECPSSLGKLIRQRMRWAEGHTFNVKKHFFPILRSEKLKLREKLEFLYYAPYYLQSALLILGTFLWVTSDVVLGSKLPFWTAAFGWGLVFTNLLALPLMSLTGLFLEKRAGKDFPGLLSQFVLIYALAPYQGYAALKGLLEPKEGSWVRTFKSGALAGFPGKLEPRKVIKKTLPPRKRSLFRIPLVAAIAVIAMSTLLLTAAAQGQLRHPGPFQPAFYFADQAAPASYAPFALTQPGSSMMMHPSLPTGPDTSTAIGKTRGSGPVFFSDPASADTPLPFGASVSMHVWILAGANSTQTVAEGQPAWPSHSTTATTGTLPEGNGTCGWNQGATASTGGVPLWATSSTSSTSSPVGGSAGCGNIEFRVDVYDPSTNGVRHIEGVGQTEVFHLKAGLHYYQAYWGNIARNEKVLHGQTLVVTMWCPDCRSPPILVFGSPSHPSNIDFPIVVPEDSLPFVALAVAVPGVAGLAVGYPRGSKDETGESGLRKVETTLIVAAALLLLTLPLVITFNDLLASAAQATGFDRVAGAVAPLEAQGVGDILRGIGLQAGSSANSVWIAGGFVPVSAFIDWNCAGWQGFVLFGLTAVFGLGSLRGGTRKMVVLVAGLAGVFAVNVFRILVVVLLGYYVGYPSALVFHDYGGVLLTLAWLLGFWTLALRNQKGGAGTRAEDLAEGWP